MSDSSLNLSMTKVEKLLKQCYQERPDIEDRILTSEELASYVGWMVDTVSLRPEFSLSADDLPGFITNSSHTGLARQLLASPKDRRTRSAISATYGQQREQQYILENHDISVNRMLRYMPPQWHQSGFFKVYCTLSGTCPLHVSEEVIPVKPGTVVIVAPDVLCATPCYADDCVLLTFMLRSSTFDRVFWNQLSQDSLLSGFFREALGHTKHAAYLHFETEDDTDLRILLIRMYREFFSPQNYSSQMLNALMSEFFILLLRRYEGTVRLPRTETFYWKHEFSAILSYIQKNYATSTIEEVAETFHYSRRQIGRTVQKYTGQTYAELVYRLRMEKAGRLLHTKELPMNEIARQTGYSTLSSFYRAFTKYFGCTPGQYENES